jgi:hypothetical protein
MTEHNDQIAFLPDRSYVIPGRLVKQLVEAAEPAPEPSDREKLIAFVNAAGIDYSWDEVICGDSGISQVWFHPPYGWELVFEFDAHTGKYLRMHLEA